MPVDESASTGQTGDQSRQEEALDLTNGSARQDGTNECNTESAISGIDTRIQPDRMTTERVGHLSDSNSFRMKPTNHGRENKETDAMLAAGEDLLPPKEVHSKMTESVPSESSGGESSIARLLSGENTPVAPKLIFDSVATICRSEKAASHAKQVAPLLRTSSLSRVTSLDTSSKIR